MIPTLSAHRGFTCVASAAASRWARARSRASVRTRRSWQCIALRWRRMMRVAGGAQPLLTRASQTTVWRSHWHLHFRPRETERPDRSPSATLMGGAHFIERHTAFVRHDVRERVRRIVVERPLLRRAPRLDRSGAPARPSSTTILRSPAVVSHRTVANARRPSLVQHASDRATEPRSTTTPRATVPASVPQSRIPARRRPGGPQATELPVSRRTALTPSRVLRVDGTSGSRMRVVPAAHITWRTSPSSLGELELPRPSRTTTGTPSAAPFTDSTPRTTAQAVASVAAAPVQIKDLDPRVIDRLADDVIRRVERRERIERERRGV